MNAIKRNLRWLLLSQLATWGVSIGLLIIAPREFGDKAFGQLSFAMVYVSFFELVALFGTGTFLMKTVARDTASLGRYVFNTLVLKLIWTMLLIALALGLAGVMGFTRETVLLIGTYCIGMLLNTLNNPLVGGLQGWQRMGRPAMWEVARSYVGAGLGVLVLMNGGGLIAFALAFNVACAIPFVANFISLWPQLRRSLSIDFELWRQVMVGGFPFLVLSALVLLYGTIDIPLLEALAGDETVGWYALAYRWVSMPAFFAASVATAFFPALSAEGVAITESFGRMANRALQLVALVATPAAIGIALVASPFVELLYGGEFSESVTLMRLLALHIPIVGIDIILASVVVAADRQRQWVMISVAAALFNPLANLIAIPLTQRWYDNGAIGAAFITVLTEALMMVGAIAIRPRGVLDRATTSRLLRIVLASLAMVPVVLALGSRPLPVQVVAGAVAYGLASWALGTVSLSEMRGWVGGGRDRPREKADVAS